MEFQSKLSIARMRGNKLKKQLSEIEDITNFYKSWEEVIKFYNDYFKMVQKATNDSKHGKGLPQAQASNTPENLLNEIC